MKFRRIQYIQSLFTPLYTVRLSSLFPIFQCFTLHVTNHWPPPTAISSNGPFFSPEVFTTGSTFLTPKSLANGSMNLRAILVNVLKHTVADDVSLLAPRWPSCSTQLEFQCFQIVEESFECWALSKPQEWFSLSQSWWFHSPLQYTHFSHPFLEPKMDPRHSCGQWHTTFKGKLAGKDFLQNEINRDIQNFLPHPYSSWSGNWCEDRASE